MKIFAIFILIFMIGCSPSIQIGYARKYLGRIIFAFQEKGYRHKMIVHFPKKKDTLWNLRNKNILMRHKTCTRS